MGTGKQLRFKRAVLDAREMALILRRMAGQLLEQNRTEGLLLLGIHTRGVPLSERLAAEIEQMEGVRPSLGALDITFYRDDLSRVGTQPVVKKSEIRGPIDGKTVVLCDDVLYTGRTVRAALDEIKDYGRPRAVRLAVLIDRGHRELPIQADVVGKAVPTAASEHVEVGLESIDGSDYVYLHERVEDEAE